jgi:hypothetical protein
VAGRVDHKSEEVSLLADLAVEWDEAAAAGEDAFARQVAAGERGGGGRRGNGWNGAGNGGGHGNAPQPGAFPAVARPLVPVGPGQPVDVGVGRSAGAGVGRLPAGVPFVSPRRGGGVTDGGPVATLPPIAPAEPISTYPETIGAATGPDQDDEPAVPDEARARIVADASADSPVEAGPETVLHVRFAGSLPADHVVSAMETFRAVLRGRPGGTQVIIHIPGPDGGPMALRRGVAYDAELLAEVRRRLGEGLVDLRLA